MSSIRRCALLCLILGAHLLLLSFLSVNDSLPIVRKFEEAPGILFFVELPRPIDPQHSTYSSSTGPIPTFDPDLEGSGARENTISLPPETEGGRRHHRLGRGSEPCGF